MPVLYKQSNFEEQFNLNTISNCISSSFKFAFVQEQPGKGKSYLCCASSFEQLTETGTYHTKGLKSINRKSRNGGTNVNAKILLMNAMMIFLFLSEIKRSH